MSQLPSVSIALPIELVGCAPHCSSLRALMYRIMTYAAPAGVTVMDSRGIPETRLSSKTRLQCLQFAGEVAQHCHGRLY